ncbi:hypothetical protein HK100_012956 [Physocladia obscura]|uniref:Tyrosine-protein kinase ephrin type A/B receptor-like domain-containing protein n=1 Tax=Physocladia obscura TaxID=109957 RepID=A0AAD5T4Y8_9FUNG|nr:hypothetical protein HK100_012956 [Physocladia obscura]
MYANLIKVALVLCGFSSFITSVPQPPPNLDSDLEIDNFKPESCLNNSYLQKYGWANFSTFTGNKRTIIFEAQYWDSSLYTSYMFYFLLTEVMGYKVNFRVYDGGPPTGVRLNYQHSTDVVLELWPSDAISWYQKYTQLTNTVTSYGSIGYTGRNGLYFPTYMLNQFPQYDSLDFWKSFTHRDTLQLFPESGTAPVQINADGSYQCDNVPFGCTNGTYDPAWYRPEDKRYFSEIWAYSLASTPFYFNRLVDGLHLNLTINFLGNNNYNIMQAAYSVSFNLTRFVFPDDQFGKYSLFQADPEHTPVPVDIPVETLFKATSAKFTTDFPELVYYVSKFQISDDTIEEMLSTGIVNGNWSDPHYYNSACEWLLENEETWKYWIPPTPTVYSTCPIGTGRYMSQSLWICLACPEGTFNLNESTSTGCQPCFAGTNCHGGLLVTVEASYWMPGLPENSTGDYLPEIHICPFAKQCCPNGNCTGGDNVCASGFHGIFCTECSDATLYPWNGKCMACSSVGASLFLTIIIPILATLAVLFVPKYHAAEIEQLFFYFQVINLIFDGDLGAVIGFSGINTILAIFSLDIDALVIDCPLPIRGVQKDLFRFMLPMLILVYFFGYFTLAKRFPEIKQMLPIYMAKQNTDVMFARSFTIVISFIFMPLVEAALVIVNCDIVDGVHVMFYSPEVVCYSPTHILPAIIAYFVLFVMFFLYPVSLFVILANLWRKSRIFTINENDVAKMDITDQIFESFYVPYRNIAPVNSLLGARKDLEGSDLPALALTDPGAAVLGRVSGQRFWRGVGVFGGRGCVAAQHSQRCRLVDSHPADVAGAKAAIDADPSLPPNIWQTIPLDMRNQSIVGFPLFSKSSWLLAGVILALKVAAIATRRLHDMIMKRSAFQMRSVMVQAIVRKSLYIDPKYSSKYSQVTFSI